jgi:hypothetical protein
MAAVCAIAAFGVVVTDNDRDCAPNGVACFVGGCESFSVYAQNRYQAYGAQIRSEPRPSATQVGSMAPNKQFAVDGWVRTQAAYPHNSPPFDNDVWFHVADASGWVSFAGVRADPTTPAEDPSNSEGGRPAPIDDECSGSVR